MGWGSVAKDTLILLVMEFLPDWTNPHPHLMFPFALASVWTKTRKGMLYTQQSWTIKNNAMARNPTWNLVSNIFLLTDSFDIDWEEIYMTSMLLLLSCFATDKRTRSFLRPATSETVYLLYFNSIWCELYQSLYLNAQLFAFFRFMAIPHLGTVAYKRGSLKTESCSWDVTWPFQNR